MTGDEKDNKKIGQMLCYRSVAIANQIILMSSNAES